MLSFTNKCHTRSTHGCLDDERSTLYMIRRTQLSFVRGFSIYPAVQNLSSINFYTSVVWRVGGGGGLDYHSIRSSNLFPCHCSITSSNCQQTINTFQTDLTLKLYVLQELFPFNALNFTQSLYEANIYFPHNMFKSLILLQLVNFYLL